MTRAHRSILPKHVTIPNWDAYQVRIVRGGREYSASFAWSKQGERPALAEAVKWRDAKLAELAAEKAKRAFLKPPVTKRNKSKQSWDRVGITRSYRKIERWQYLRFSVGWTDRFGKHHLKTFSVGNVKTITPEDERHAAETAEAFRAEWEFCRAVGRVFDPLRYHDWKTRRLYPFQPDK